VSTCPIHPRDHARNAYAYIVDKLQHFTYKSFLILFHNYIQGTSIINYFSIVLFSEVYSILGDDSFYIFSNSIWCLDWLNDMSLQLFALIFYLCALIFRQTHMSFFEKSDLSFVCMLRPLSFDIQKQESEIEAAQVIQAQLQ